MLTENFFNTRSCALWKVTAQLYVDESSDCQMLTMNNIEVEYVVFLMWLLQ